MRTFPIAIILLLVLCAGCAGEKQLRAESAVDAAKLRAEYATKAEKSLKESLAHQHETHGLKPVDARFIRHVSVYERQPRSTPEPPYKERVLPNAGDLVQGKPGDRVMFYGMYCLIGSSCGCDLEMKYSFAEKPDGSVVILVPAPQKEVHTITHPGACSYGCGQPSGSPAFTIWELPTTDIDHVTEIVVPYELHIVHETCEKPIPAP
ncbi:hypothetical protein [Polyangium mundeleinium]|uniref:Lipoprotein n=1 Tax=Polyangium mundeleinium TaxID=2995306 RepID=A0ABT5EUB7_9BACT|nr:hypothetical protein [Polyangium mundeleinium]MDC0744341.1 hypothetical protein [Polyangium mundeleinium]